MRKFNKAICLMLLLSLVVSVFAVFPAFAADDAKSGTDSSEGIKTLYDMDAMDSIKVENAESGLKIYRDKEGYWVTDFSDYNKDHPSSLQPYINLPLGDIFVADANVIENHEYDGVDGNKYTTTAGFDGKRNTKYLVIDFDISTTSQLIEMIYFNLRHTDGVAPNQYAEIKVDHDGDGTKEVYNIGNNTVSAHPTIQQTTYGWYSHQSGGGGTKRYPLYNYHQEWVNVTFVYDYSENVAYDGGVDRSHWGIYVFFDGVYAGKIGGIKNTTARVWFARMSFGIPTTEGTTARFNNLTLKQFTTDYKGVLDHTDIRGINLNDISELAYTQEGCPADKVIASITRGEETTYYTDARELDSELELGDVLTLYANIDRTYVVQDNNGDGVGITVVDNGFKAPTFAEYDLSKITYVVRDYYSGKVAAVRDQSGYNLSYTATVKKKNNLEYTVTDYQYVWEDGKYVIKKVNEEKKTLTTAPSKDSTSYSNLIDDDQFWKDITGDTDGTKLGKTRKSIIVTYYNSGVLMTNNSDDTVLANFHVEFDLNGNTLYSIPLGQHILSSDGAQAKPVFKDGTIEYTYGTGHNLLITNNNASDFVILFDKINLNIKSGVFVDQRGGIFYYKDCNINSGGTFMSVKSSNGRYSSVVLDNSNYTASTYDSISTKSISSGGTIYNGMQNFIVARNGSRVESENFVYMAAGFSASDSVKNNYVNVGLYNSHFKGTRVMRIVGANLSSATMYSQNIDLVMIGSDIDTYRIARTQGLTASTSSYQYNVNVYSAESRFVIDPASNGAFDRGCKVSKLTFTVDDGSIFSKFNNMFTSSTNCKLVYTDGTNPTYVNFTHAENPNLIKMVVNPGSIKTHSYPKADGSVGTLEWSVDYPISLAKLDGLKELEASSNPLYRLEYRVVDNEVKAVAVPNFALRVNLTLSDNLLLNLFVEKKDGVNLSVLNNGEALDAKYYSITEYTMGGVVYDKVQIRGITPQTVADEYTIVCSFDDGAEASKTITVLDYLASAYTSPSTNEKGKLLLEEIYAYIYNTNRYLNNTFDVPANFPIRYEAPTVNKYESSDSLGIEAGIAIDGNGVRWIVSGLDANADKIAVSYYVDGKAVNTEAKVINGQAVITVKACDLLYDITVGGTTFNYGNYAAAVVKTSNDANLVRLIHTLYSYAVAANNYKNPKAA